MAVDLCHIPLVFVAAFCGPRRPGFAPRGQPNTGCFIEVAQDIPVVADRCVVDTADPVQVDQAPRLNLCLDVGK